MNKFEIVKLALSKATGRTGLLIQKNSPQILMVIGVSGIIVGGVMACKATLKAESIINNHKERIDNIKTVSETTPDEVYSDMDYKKDITITYAQTARDFIKLYGPSVSISVISIGCMLGANGILKSRNVALAAAYKLVEEGFSSYRGRVVDEFGEDVDRKFKHGVRAESITEVEVNPDTGKKTKVKKTKEVVDPNGHSVYAKWFDESNANWSKTPEYNLLFLKAQQSYANDMLRSRGHVFLNEIYDTLGIERTQAGAVVGWVISEDGDNFIDFGMYDADNYAARSFINGEERSILLDFNVDGVIYDLI